MQRDLAAWGVPFEQLLDDVLLHYAAIELQEDCKSVTDVAFDLGYSDSAHFTRAFKRWTGCTPRQFRSGEVPAPHTITGMLSMPGSGGPDGGLQA